MLVANSKPAMACSVVTQSLPSGLSQHHRFDAVDVMHYLAFMLLLGCVGYFGLFWVVWVTTRVFRIGRCSYRTLHKASTVTGVASFLFMPAMYFATNLPSGIIRGVTETGLLIAFPVTALGVAIRILLRAESSPEAG